MDGEVETRTTVTTTTRYRIVMEAELVGRLMAAQRNIELEPGDSIDLMLVDSGREIYSTEEIEVVISRTTQETCQ